MRKITYWLAVILIFMVPWEDSISVATLGSMARLMGLVVAAFWVATMLIEGRFRKPHLFHALVLLFFLWNFVSVFWSPNPESTTQRIKTYSQIFLLILIFWEVFQKPENLMTGLQAYVFGKGPILNRAKIDIVEENGKFRIIISELTYQTNKSTLLEKIADLVKEKKLEGIRDIRDESDKDGIRIVIELKNDAFPQKILNKLYKYWA